MLTYPKENLQKVKKKTTIEQKNSYLDHGFGTIFGDNTVISIYCKYALSYCFSNKFSKFLQFI